MEEFDKNLQDEFNLSNALVQTDRQAVISSCCWKVGCRRKNAPALEHELDKQGYFFQQLEIEDGDKVPIKLRNNKFSKLYEPITKMFSLPNYGELDPTPLFAPFFMLFFGLCFGDGGYGLLVMIACTILKKKVNPDFKPYLTLFQYLGFAALLVGTCTGSFFGVALADIPALSKIKNYFVNSDNLMTFSIVIGLVQIIFGKLCRCLQDQDTERNETQYRSVRLGVRDHILGIGVRTSDVERSLAERCRYGMLRNRHLGSGCRLFVQYTGQERILELWYRTLEHVQYGLRIAGGYVIIHSFVRYRSDRFHLGWRI